MQERSDSATGQAAALRILVIGPRRGLIRTLDDWNIPYVVWTERARTLPAARHVHVAPVAVGETGARREAESLREHGPFSHVIAGGENAVVPASVARRVLGARQSSHSTVIRCRDKLKMKAHLREHEIPMTDFLSGSTTLAPGEIAAQLGLPLVVKRRSQSGGKGLEIIEGVDDLPEIVERGTLLERFVDAPEVSVESFVSGGQVRFESMTEYANKTHVNVVPARIDEATRSALLDLNRRVIRALKIDWGMTHAEFYVTPDGVLFGEIALRPPGGYIMDLLPRVWGFDAWQAFVATEIDRPFEFPERAVAHAAAVILHPGAGQVRAIHGVEEVRGHESVDRVAIKVRPGDRIEARDGVGKDVGHLLLRAPTASLLQDGLLFVDKHLRIELDAIG